MFFLMVHYSLFDKATNYYYTSISMFESIFYSLVNTILGIIELLLSVRIILRFFNASASSPFVYWIYETTQPLIAPFAGAFPNPRLEGGIIIEFSALFALLFYAFIGYLLDTLFYRVRYYRRYPDDE